MYHNLLPVRSASTKTSLTEFSAWLKQIPNSLLVAHNVAYDSRVLVDAYANAGMEDELQHVIGFSDSIRVFKEVYPGRPSYKLGELATAYAPTIAFQAHTATADVDMLRHLLQQISASRELLFKHSFSTETAILNNQKNANRRRHISSYCNFIDNNLLSKASSNTLASSGVNANHLRLAHKRGGREGLHLMLKGKITKAESVSAALDTYFISDEQ